MNDSKNKINSAPIQALVRPSALDVRGQQPSLFPFDAFEFNDPNQTDFPELKMKAPWRFVADYIKSSGDSWNYSGNVGQIPSGAYFSALRYTNETSVALLNKADDDLLASEGVSGIEEGVSPYTIAGIISYDLTGIPAYVLDGGYTIIVYSEFTGWEYLSGSGVSKGNLISKVGDVFTLTSSNTLPQLLKFRLRGYLETFRDLMVIPQNYTQSSIDDLLEDVTTFSWESGTLSSDRGYILSPDGFYWYNGAQYIKLGTEAIFSGVDLKSGQWDGEITDGEITSNGTEGWALSSKGDFEANDGTFRGELAGATGNFSGDIITENLTVNGNVDMPDIQFINTIITPVSFDLENDTAESIFVKVEDLRNYYLSRDNLMYFYGTGWTWNNYLALLIQNNDETEPNGFKIGSDYYNNLNYLLFRLVGDNKYFYLSNSPEWTGYSQLICEYNTSTENYAKHPFTGGSNKVSITNVSFSSSAKTDFRAYGDITAAGNISSRGGHRVAYVSKAGGGNFTTKSEVASQTYRYTNGNSADIIGWVLASTGIRYPALLEVGSSAFTRITWNGSRRTYLLSDGGASDIYGFWI